MKYLTGASMREANIQTTRCADRLSTFALLFVLQFLLSAPARATLSESTGIEMTPRNYHPGDNQIPEPSGPCSPEVAAWWQELREAGKAAARATARKEKAVIDTVARMHSKRQPVPDDEKDFMPPDDLAKLNEEVSRAKQKYMGLIVKGTNGSYSVPIKDGGPIVLHFNQPRYSAAARALAIQGVVKTRVVFGSDGQVKQVRIVKGIELLDEQALRAVYDLIYLPARVGGQFVAYIMPVDVEFNLR